MYKNIFINFIEYLSLSLVLSFIMLHNILLVFIGIIIAVFGINKTYLNKITKLYNANRKEILEIEVVKPLESKCDNSKTKEKVSELKLVYKIEELGYIPSIQKENNSNAA
tara:strand:+ start:510 stop:839 length:330 start_codon:yes stop_codon:yes gene_type:complete